MYYPPSYPIWFIFRQFSAKKQMGQTIGLMSHVLQIPGSDTTRSVAGLRAARDVRPPPGGPNSFIFMQFSAKKIG